MNYQLVVQFQRDLKDFDELIAIETEIAADVGERAFMDGHDFGSGEFNFFLFTDSPIESFDRLRPFLQRRGSGGKLSVAYRSRAEEKYVVLSPPGAKSFTVR